MSGRDRGTRSGMTVVELLIALLIFGAIVTGALRYLAVQSRSFRSGLEELSALQGARFALQNLEIDLGTAGTNVAPGQPFLVAAGKDVIAFNADYATNVADDPFAAFHDPDAPDHQVVAPSPKLTIPNTGFQYPDTLYTSGGAASSAELLVYYFAPDTTTEAYYDYALYRQVNEADPELVARRLLPSGHAPFFRYFRETASGVDSVPDSELPLLHEETIHLSGADTGAAAVVDSVVAVRITLVGSNGRFDEHEETTELSRLVRLRNAGIGSVEACGAKPILGTPLAATLLNPEPGEYEVELSWSAATDETGGEGDVMRYVIWRREPPTVTWEDPFLSIPAGSAAYTYTDESVESGETYEYGLAAQDCTPTLSDVTESASVTIP